MKPVAAMTRLIYCGDCGCSADEDDEFCVECGKPIRHYFLPVTCPRCGATYEISGKGAILCVSCGKAVRTLRIVE